MIVEHINNTTIITQEKKTFSELIVEIGKIYENIKNNNIIINIFSLSKVKASDLDEFLSFSNKHKQAKHSFVIVSKSVIIDDVAENLEVVPTLKEAHDLIGMEEIERDLGF